MGPTLIAERWLGTLPPYLTRLLSIFLVNFHSVDPEVFELIGGFVPSIEEPTSIMRFLTLPTVTWQRHTKIRDPIFDFSLSKFLTSDEYANALEQMKHVKEMTQRLKE